jgi:hypothetical protein
MQYIVGAFIIGVFVGICLGYDALYGDLNEFLFSKYSNLKENYSDITVELYIAV